MNVKRVVGGSCARAAVLAVVVRAHERGVHDRTRFRRARSRRLGADMKGGDASCLRAYWTSCCLWQVSSRICG